MRGRAGYNLEMSKASASVFPSPPVVRRTKPAAAPRPSAERFAPDRENEIRRMAELLRRVNLAPSPGFAGQMRAAQSQREVDGLLSDQIQRAINAVRAEARAEKKTRDDDADSRGG